MSDSTEDSLAHYGKLGMKWGKTKGKGASKGSAATKNAPKPFPRTSADHKTAQKAKKKPASAMSNAELKAFTNRVNLEQQYSKLNPGKIAKGKKYLDTALAVGTTVNSVMTFAKSPAGQILIKSLKK